MGNSILFKINRKFLKNLLKLLELNRLVGIRKGLDSNQSSRTLSFSFLIKGVLKDSLEAFP